MQFGSLLDIDNNKEYPLENLPHQGNIIGRIADTTPPEVNIKITTTDEAFSRKHCEIKIFFRPPHLREYQVFDLGSTNGTKLLKQGDRSQMITLSKDDIAYLDDGDVLELGRTKLRLKLPTRPTKSRSLNQSR